MRTESVKSVTQVGRRDALIMGFISELLIPVAPKRTPIVYFLFPNGSQLLIILPEKFELNSRKGFGAILITTFPQ